jgi:hypothetical protein
MKTRKERLSVERLSLPNLHASEVERRMQPRSISVIEVILLLGEHKVDFAALWQIDGLIKDEPAAAHASTKSQSHPAQASATRHDSPVFGRL